MDDESIKQLAQKAGLSEEEAKKKTDATEMAFKMGAELMIGSFETEASVTLTDEQKKKLATVYQMAFMFSLMGMPTK